jgi:nucleoside-diphosphate-sugar epimerase
MRVLVTGGSGFIGTALVHDLLAEGHDVSIYDLQQSETYAALTVVGDIRDERVLSRACRDIDLVYHLAAVHADDVEPVSLYHEVNVGGAKALIAACEEHTVRRVVFASTVALYGLNVGIPTEESPAQPFNEYGKSKHDSEKVLLGWAERAGDRHLAIVRPVVIFGERNRGNVYNLMKQITGGRFVMVGDGNNRKSMGYIGNFSCFLVRLASVNGIRVFNYADKPDLSASELVAAICLATGSRVPRGRLPYSVALMAGYVFDAAARLTGIKFPISAVRIRKFCANTQVEASRMLETGFRPQYALEDAISRMATYEFGPGSAWQGGGR